MKAFTFIKKIIPCVAVLLALLVLIPGCGITGRVVDASNERNTPIKIGAILMLTGVGANVGSNSQKGVELAVEEINVKGGVLGRPLTIVYEDNGDDATGAITALRKLTSQDIDFILGPNWSPSGLATAPIACEEGTVMISPSLGVAGFNEACDYLFNVWPHDAGLSETLGHDLVNREFKRIAILGSLQVWEHEQALAVKKGVEGAGGQVVSFILAKEDEKDYRSEVAKIKESKPDAVVFTDFSYESLAAKRMKEQGVDVPFFSVLLDEDRIKNAEGAFEGTIVITSFTPTKNFVDQFAAKYHAQPDMGADTSYDAIKLIAEAIEKTQSTDPKSVKDYLNKLTTVTGASGTFTFDGKGGVTKKTRFMVVKDGKMVDQK